MTSALKNRLNALEAKRPITQKESFTENEITEILAGKRLYFDSLSNETNLKLLSDIELLKLIAGRQNNSTTASAIDKLAGLNILT